LSKIPPILGVNLDQINSKINQLNQNLSARKGISNDDLTKAILSYESGYSEILNLLVQNITQKDKRIKELEKLKYDDVKKPQK